MTKDQISEKIQKMIADDVAFLLRRTKTLLESGAIDFAAYQDNYRLPGILLCAAIENLLYERSPVDKKDRKEVRNLSLF